MIERKLSFLDQCLIQFDHSLKTILNKPIPERANPAAVVTEQTLTAEEKKYSAALMRVNHTGEVCAQALYHAQAITARSKKLNHKMQQAAIEENDHLFWCQERLEELNSHRSYLNPLWYMGSFMIGIVAGIAGDKWNLGFVAETERQVVKHLDKHLIKLPEQDEKSKSILSQMREDEAHHATVAVTAGAAELPGIVKTLMGYTSWVMTSIAFYI